MSLFTKKKAIEVVTSCAKKYKENLVNQSLLFICIDKHKRTSAVTFTFDAANFMHLTGLKPVKRVRTGPGESSAPRALSATEFYHMCLDNKLKEEDFCFSDPRTTELKLTILPKLMTKNLSADRIGDFQPNRPMLMTEKLAGGKNACIGFVQDRTSKRLVPNTVLKEDINNLTFQTQRVVACYRKTRGESQYREITYLSKKIDLDSVKYPEEYAYLKELAAVGA